MPKLRRRFFSALAVVAIVLWLCVFRLYSIGINDHINNSITNVSGTAQALRNDACPPNEDRDKYVELLNYWHYLAKFHSISYVICCGSLLGHYRNGDIIPWDKDVDVLVDITKFKKLKALGGKRNFKQRNNGRFHFVVQPDFQRTQEVMRRRLSCTGKLVDSQIDSCSFVSPMARVIRGFFHLDIFPYVVYQSKRVVRDLDMRRNYKIKDFFPFKECLFMNVKTWCPRNTRGVMESAYDDNLEPDYSCVNGTWVSKRS